MAVELLGKEIRKTAPIKQFDVEWSATGRPNGNTALTLETILENWRMYQMRQLKTQSASMQKFVAFEFLIFVMVGSAFGQTVTKAVFKIPFEFGAGSKVLPAGTYTFSLDTGRSLVDVSSPSGKQVSLHIVTRLGGPSELREFSLVFDKTGEHHVLSEVWLPKTDGVLVHSVPKDHEHEILIGSFGGQSLSGKAAFDQTCSRCHGKDGRGDENADRFFKTKIPRLSEAYVQGKSDAELKEIITKGTRAMEPVRIEEAGFRHLLPLESVDSVIVYVRTLKP